MAGLGVTVDFNANLTRFTSALDKATTDLNKFQSNTSRISGSIGKSFGALGAGLAAGLSVGAFTGFIKGSIDALDNLNDLNKKTGVSVEQLSGLGLAAKQSGSDLESIASSINKLSKNIGADGEKFKALGVTAKDPIEAFKQLADIFVAVKDPQARAALGAEALGKSWEGAAPLLAEGGKNIGEMVEKGMRLSKVTTESAQAADKFNDELAELKAISGGLGTKLASEMLGPLTEITSAVKLAYEESGKLQAAWVALGAVGAFLFTDQFASNKVKLEGVNKELKNLLSIQKDMQGAGSVMQFVYGDNKERDNNIKNLQAQKAELEKAMAPPEIKPKEPEKTDPDAAKRVCEFGGGVWDGTTCKKPEKKGAAAPKDDPSKKLLDNSIKDLERQRDQENEILASRNRFLDLYNSENLLSLKDYYDGKKAAQEENIVNSVALLDKEIAALEVARAQAGKKTDQTEITGKINAAVEAKAKIQRAAGEEAIAMGFQEARAYKEIGLQIRGVSADLLEMQGKIAEAAKIRIDDQFKPVLDRFNAQGDSGSVKLVNDLKAAQVAQAEFGQAAAASGQLLEALRNTEERLAITRSTGAITELDYLQQISRARADTAAKLESEVAIQEKLGQSSGLKNLQLQAESARNAMKQLESQSDLVAQKFNTVFEESFGNAFGEFISGTKSAKEAFRDFAGSVVQQIAKIAAQNLAQSLFGDGSKGGGVGGLLAGLFGASSGGGTSLAALNGGGNIVGLATGGPAAAGSLHEVNEKGPELLSTGGKTFLMMGAKGGIVTPNNRISAGSGGGSVSINYSPNIQIDSRSDRAQVQQDVQRAVANGNAQLVDQLSRAGRI